MPLPLQLLCVLLLPLLLDGVKSGEAPRLNPLYFPTDLEAGMIARSTCTARSGQMPATFQWLKDGAPFSRDLVPFSSRQLDDYTSALTLGPLHEGHVGNYTCVVTNSEGSDSTTAPLLIKVAPRFVEEPFNVSVEEGDSISVPCSGAGSPKPRVDWSKEGHNHLSEQRWKLGVNGSLTMPRARKEDAGLYACRLDNGVGDAISRVIKISVWVRPRISQKYMSQSVERGKDVMLSCKAEGDHPLEFTWTKDRRELGHLGPPQHRLSQKDETDVSVSQLLITNAEPQDAGIYICTTKNEAGQDSMSIRLAVNEKPSSPVDVEISDLWSRNVRIRWTSPYAGNTAVMQYIMEYWEINDPDGDHKNVSISGSLNYIVLDNLRPATAYRLRLWASNNVGISPPSTQVQFTTSHEGLRSRQLKITCNFIRLHRNYWDRAEKLPEFINLVLLYKNTLQAPITLNLGKSNEPSAPPEDLKIDTSGATFVRISWKAPPWREWNGPLQGFYVGYKAPYASSPYSFYTAPFTNASNHFVLRGLQRSSSYQVVIKAFNSAGTGPPSKPLMVTTNQGEAPPRPMLTILTVGSTSMQLKGAVMSEDFHITGYKVYYRPEQGEWQDLFVPRSDENKFTLGNLDPGKMYQIYLLAQGGFGDSEPSETVTIRTAQSSSVVQGSSASGANLNRGGSATTEEDLVLTQTLYIVIPIVVATVLIVTIVVGACLYVYYKRPLHLPLTTYPVPPPGLDMQKDHLMPYHSGTMRPTLAKDPHMMMGAITPGGQRRAFDSLDLDSHWSTDPTLKTNDSSTLDEEPIYESVIDEMRTIMKQRAHNNSIRKPSPEIYC